jgi:uncharacterized transporter YbjL
LPNRSELIALSYGITYIWGTVGIILICKYLPRWWGVDAKAAAKRHGSAQDLHRRLHRLLGTAVHRLGDRLSCLQDQSRGLDG